MNRSLAMMAFVALLSGCATSGDEIPKTVELSDHYRESKPDSRPVIAPETAWWSSFGDQTLNQLISDGLSQSLTVAQAQERIVAAQATERVNGGGYNPSVNGSVEATRSGKDTASTYTGTDALTAAVASSWKFDLFGGGAKTRAALAAKTVAARESLNQAKLDLIANVANRYFEIRNYQRRLVIARNTQSVQSQTLDLTKAQLDAGSASNLDAIKASASYYSTSADVPTLTAAKGRAEHQLAILLGLEPSALGEALQKRGTERLPKVNFSTGIPADLIRNRPDIRMAEANLAAAVADIGIKEADLYPSLTLAGSFSITGSVNEIKNWSLGPTLTIPLFDRDRLVANVDLSKSTAKQAYMAYRATVLAAVGEVEDALISLKQERSRKALLTRSVDASRQSAQLSETQYELGAISFSDKLTAQSQLYQAENLLAISAYNEVVYYISLCKALGGGWLADGKAS